MNVLYVCRNNTGRSQVAMEFHNRLSHEKAKSGGTQVEEPEKLVKDRPGAKTILEAMNEYGIDMGDNPRVQLTEDMIEGYDKIVVMAEPQTVPKWITNKSNVIYWDVLDIKDQPIKIARKLRDQILDKVSEFLNYPNREARRKILRSSKKY